MNTKIESNPDASVGAPGFVRLTRYSILIFALAMCGCDIDPTSEPVQQNEVVGSYSANFHAGLAEQLELRVDSTYSYFFKDYDGSEHKILGKYVLFCSGENKAHPAVALCNFRRQYPLDMGCYRPRSSRAGLDTSRFDWGIPVFKYPSGRIVLVLCPNEGQYYVKDSQD
jgi:hypothetical protein